VLDPSIGKRASPFSSGGGGTHFLVAATL